MGEGIEQHVISFHPVAAVHPLVVGSDGIAVPEHSVVVTHTAAQVDLSIQGAPQPVERMPSAMVRTIALDVAVPFELKDPAMGSILDDARGGLNVRGDIAGLEELLSAVRVDASRTGAAVAQEHGVELAWTVVNGHGYLAAVGVELLFAPRHWRGVVRPPLSDRSRAPLCRRGLAAEEGAQKAFLLAG